jgi:hypothetical protein
VRFQVLTATSMKTTVVWDVEPCSAVGTYRRFRVLTASIMKTMMMIRRWTRVAQYRLCWLTSSGRHVEESSANKVALYGLMAAIFEFLWQALLSLSVARSCSITQAVVDVSSHINSHSLPSAPRGSLSSHHHWVWLLPGWKGSQLKLLYTNPLIFTYHRHCNWKTDFCFHIL